jgi:hypothetical protein
MEMRNVPDQQQEFFFNEYTGDKSWGDLRFELSKPSDLAPGVRALSIATTELGHYSLELQANNNIQLAFNSAKARRVCPKKFQAINTAQDEANDHYNRLLAQRQQPAPLKPPKW